MNKIIFHHPLPLSKKPNTGSQLRPVKMLEAFKNMGYEVHEITGYAKERKVSIKKIKENIQNGTVYDFIYCENSTMPTLLTEKSHLPLHPFLDFNFFKYANSKNIPIGLFYRDIHWKFSFYDVKVQFLKRLIAKAFYYYELFQYNTFLKKLFIPSDQMAQYLPIIKTGILSELPPGHDISSKIENPKQTDKDQINFIYVGGLSDFYDLTLFITVLEKFPQYHLTICTRDYEWQAIKEDLMPLPKNITITHKTNSELDSLYAQADVALLYVKPHEYWSFAVPIKLMEYVGHKKPILVSDDLWSSDFVRHYKNGWVITYDENHLQKFLSQLTKYQITDTADSCNICATDNTWLARARRVKAELMGQ